MSHFLRGITLRETLTDGDKALCVDFVGTLQAEDIKKRNDLIPDALNGAYCYRAKINVKEFDVAERAKYGLPPFDFSDEQAIKRALKEEFDLPLWMLRAVGDDLRNIGKYNLPLIYQLKGCNFHSGHKGSGCAFCFVDDDSNSGAKKGGVFLSPENVIATFRSVQDSLSIHHIRFSGGEPTLALNHILAVLKKINSTSPFIPFQFDSNLSTGSLIDWWIQNGALPADILEQIAVFDPKVLVCFKGVDDLDIAYNTHSICNLSENLYSLRKLVLAGFDVYPHIINPYIGGFRKFLGILEENFENILPKLHVLKINVYEPMKERIRILCRGKDFEAELKRHIIDWNMRYLAAIDILNDVMNKKYGVDYKDISRPGIKLVAK